MVATRIDRAIRPWLYSREYASGLSAALTSLSAGAIRRVVLTGTEDVTGTLAVPSNCEIEGDARNGATLRVPAGSTFRVLDLDGTSNVAIRNLTFAKQSGSALGGNCHAVSIRGTCDGVTVEGVIADAFPMAVMASGSSGTVAGTVTNLTLRKVRAKNSPNDWGMELADVDTALIEDCHSTGHWFDGLKFRKLVHGVTVLGGEYSDNGVSFLSDDTLNGDGIDGYAGAERIALIGVSAYRNNGSGFNFKAGELNRDSGTSYGYVRKLDFIGCVGRLNKDNGINLNLNDQADTTQPLVAGVTIQGGTFEENTLDGIYGLARNLVITGAKVRRNTRRGLTLPARTMHADLIGVISLANGAGEGLGCGAYINGAKHVSILGGTYLGVDADLVGQESDYAALTKYHLQNILIDNSADDIEVRGVKHGYATDPIGIVVNQTTGDIRVHGRNTGAPTVTGQYGAKGSTYIQTDAGTPYDVEWTKASANPNQATTGWIRRLPITTTATLNFPSIAAGSTSELTVSLTGVTFADMVEATPNAALESGLVWSAYVSANNVVTVRLANVTGGAIDPVSAAWRVSGRRQ